MNYWNKCSHYIQSCYLHYKVFSFICQMIGQKEKNKKQTSNVPFSSDTRKCKL